MIDINLYKIKKNYGFDNLFNEISLDIKHGEHVALIGDNGSGKTTLLNIIAGIEKIDSGVISIRNNTKIGYLKQIPDDNDLLVQEIIYRNFEEIYRLKDKMTMLEKNLTDKNINKYLSLQQSFIDKKGYEIEADISKALQLFKVDNSYLQRYFKDLSGGEKMIISLASIYLNKPDILLLDEPTNHLDIKVLDWLENFLNNYNGTIVMVSHDRYFLDKVAHKIFLIENHNIDIYHGNYTYYVEEHAKRKEIYMQEYLNQEKKIDKMQQSIKQLRYFGTLGDNEAFFKRANSMQKRLDKMDKLDKPKEKKNIPLIFQINNRTGKEVLKIKKYNVVINDNLLIKDINLDLFYQERLCIMGSNGCGKSTLIKDILSNKEEIVIGSNVLIGYIPQEISFENELITVMEEARKYYVGDEAHLRSSLNKFLFTKDNIYKRLDKLSGGERIRLKLFCLMQSNCNLLIFDEPTNHIDIDTREILEQALLDYLGTLIFVSHDRYFINKLATKIAYINNKQLNIYHGNYDECKEI